MCHKRVFSVVLAVAATLPAAVRAGSLTIRLEPPFVVERATGTDLRQFPFAFGLASARSPEKSTVFVGYSQQRDSGAVEPNHGARVSQDGGKTFTEYVAGVPFINAWQRKDGTVVTVDFRTRRRPDGDGTRFEVDFRESSDGGKTWGAGIGELIAPQRARSLYFHRGIMAARDGALLVPLYGRYAQDVQYRSMFARSTDGGRNWKIISTIATAAAPSLLAAAATRKPAGPNETTVVRCADGSLLAVFRTGGDYPLHQCRSRDDGLTWSEPVMLPGLSKGQAIGVNPHVVRIANGALVLAYGRPGMRLAVSADGDGESWGEYTNVFEGEKTSGYPTLLEVTPNRLLLVGDTGVNWQYKLEPFPDPNPFSIWGRFVEIERR